jgi:hypothetical protein
MRENYNNYKIGFKKNDLTLKEITDERSNAKVVGIFICNCGKEKKAKICSVVRGDIKHCGCKRSQSTVKKYESFIGKSLNGRTAIQLINTEINCRGKIKNKRYKSKMIKIVAKCDKCGQIRTMAPYQYINSINKCQCTKIKDEIGVMQRKIIARVKINAETRRLEYSLSDNTVLKIIKEPCVYCGEKPSNKVKNIKTGYEYSYQGIDRLDNKKGYVEDNIVPCCAICNKMKLDSEWSDFIWHIKKIYDHTITGIIEPYFMENQA